MKLWGVQEEEEKKYNKWCNSVVLDFCRWHCWQLNFSAVFSLEFILLRVKSRVVKRDDVHSVIVSLLLMLLLVLMSKNTTTHHYYTNYKYDDGVIFCFVCCCCCCHFFLAWNHHKMRRPIITPKHISQSRHVWWFGLSVRQLHTV